MSPEESSPDVRESGDAHASRAARRIVAVGGGKGGTGKSLVASSVGIYLATLGKKVVLVDADLGAASLHTFLGVERPAVSIADLLERRIAGVDAAVVDTPIPNLGLISGEGDPAWMGSLRPAQRGRLLGLIQQLKVDYLVIDVGPGSSSTELELFLLADVGLVVLQPEPTSVETGIRFLKSAFMRRLRRQGLDEIPPQVERGGGVPAPLDLYLAAPVERQPALLAEMRALRARLVMNQVRARADVDLGAALASAARRRLGLPIDYLGHLEHDDVVWLSVRKRRPLVVEQPESRAAKGVERLTRRLLALENEGPSSFEARRLGELSHYEILEIDPSVTDEEIRRAYRRVREAHGFDSLVVAGLYDRARLAEVHQRIDDAYETLIDDERRRAYDHALHPEGTAERRRSERSGPVTLVEEIVVAPPPDPTMPPRPPEPAITSATDFTGAILRQIREARGIELATISQRTKITVTHLRAIEDESLKAMPAMVYVRGFLVEYARFLRLDVERVLGTYFTRLRNMRTEGQEGR